MQLLKSLLVGVTFAGAMSVANATPITWVDAIDFTPDRYIAPHASSSYTQLELSGLYDVTIFTLDGAFLGSPTLTVRGDRPSSVPEPAHHGLW